MLEEFPLLDIIAKLEAADAPKVKKVKRLTLKKIGILPFKEDIVIPVIKFEGGPERTLNECLICGRTKKLSSHHLVPVAYPKRWLLKFQGISINRKVPLCTRCHDLVHKIFGPGHEYKGPLRFCEFEDTTKRLFGIKK